ncbi:MAG: hypothetical protein CM15mV115_170 [Caudoviricetes sp.]|nr:MAG: hypothetical protein CM15mV115_170 [Caudoviricetes sp.]
MIEITEEMLDAIEAVKGIREEILSVTILGSKDELEKKCLELRRYMESQKTKAVKKPKKG